jgi:hypothetical protein
MEDETALSIIDPVTVNMDMTHRPRSATTRDIPHATISPTVKVLEVSHHLLHCIELHLKIPWMINITVIFNVGNKMFQIQMQQQLNIRLSYHDMRMFIQMLNSLPKQTLWARSHDSDHDRQPANVQSK